MTHRGFFETELFVKDDDKDIFFLSELGERIQKQLQQEAAPVGECSTPILEMLNEERYRYSEKSLLVEGGAKKIYKVYDTHAGRWVVMAMPIKAETLDAKETFLREALMVSKLQHPAILPVHEVGITTSGVPYYVRQFLEGDTLLEVIKKADKKVTLDRLVSIFLRVCDAVKYAHSCGVLHLDIKPENVLVGLHGRVYLIDWGMARVLPSKAEDMESDFDPDILNNVRYSGMLQGTPGFMAPEQINQSGRWNEQTDVYGLGALLYFILTHRSPVSGTRDQQLEQTVRGEVVGPHVVQAKMGIPRSLSAISMKATALEPASRYASVSELRDDISLYREGFAPRAEKTGLFKRGHLFLRRHHKVGFVVLLVAGLFIGMTSYLLARVSAQKERTEAARLEAIQNLDLYRVETERTVLLNSRIQKFLIDSMDDGDIWNVSLMHNLVKQELERSKDDSRLQAKFYKYQAYLFFVEGAFNQALQSFKRAGFTSPHNNLYKTCEEFAALKPSDEDLLSPNLFAQLLEFSFRNSSFRKNILAVSYREYMKRTGVISPEQYFPIAIGILNVVNDTIGWEGENLLQKLKEGYHLDLRNAPYHTLDLPRESLLERDPYHAVGNVLLPLQLYSLDLSGSNIRDFEDLAFSEKFEELIIQDVLLFDRPSSVFWLMQSGVKKIVVDEELFRPSQLKKLRSVMQVLVTSDSKNENLIF